MGVRIWSLQLMARECLNKDDNVSTKHDIVTMFSRDISKALLISSVHTCDVLAPQISNRKAQHLTLTQEYFDHLDVTVTKH